MGAQLKVEYYDTVATSWVPLTKVNNTWQLNWGQLPEETKILQFRAVNIGDKTAKAINLRETSDSRSYGALALAASQSWITDGSPLALGNIEPGQSAGWQAKLDIPLGALKAAGLGFNWGLYNY